MAGQWQREFFLITEDPFAVDLGVFDFWLDGLSVGEAAEIRWKNFDWGGTPSLDAHGPAPSQILFQQFSDLLRQDCAQQYEAFEFLEGALADPVHFLEFCPVQLAPHARRHFVSRYYSLDNSIVREILRHPNALQIRLQGGGDRKAIGELDQIARASGVKALKVKRILENLQRACRWVEHAASQRFGAASTSAHNAGASGGGGGSGGSAEGPEDANGSGGSANSLNLPTNRKVGTSIPLVPELDALGEPLLWRYRSLTFLLLCRFDLWSKPSLSLRTEQVEDIAAILLASGGVLDSASEVRARYVEVLTPPVSAALGNAGAVSSTSLSGGVGTPAYAGASSVGSVVLESGVRECLRELESKVLRPRYHDIKGLLLHEFDKPTEGASPSAAADDQVHKSLSKSEWGRGFFARGVIAVGLKTTKVDPTMHALWAGVASLTTPGNFRNFFGILADFVDKVRQLDSSDPLELFQCCYTALELLGERDQASSKKGFVLNWLYAWGIFLEFYRACAACIFSSSSPSPSPTRSASKDPVSDTRTGGGLKAAQQLAMIASVVDTRQDVERGLRQEEPNVFSL